MIRSALDWNARFRATSRTAFLAVLAVACSLTAVAQISPSTNALLNEDGSTDAREDERPQLASDGRGNWVAVWDGQDVGGSPTGTDLDIFVSRSTDAGVTWSPQAPLNTNSDTDFGDDLRPTLSTDNAGRWLAVWYSNHDLGGISGTDFDIFYAISTDAGLTWTAPALLNSNATTDSGDDEIPKVATDGANQWVVVWNSNENLGGITGGDYDVFVARSSNGGASWTAPALLNSNGTVDGEDDIRTELISDGLGNWVVAWSSGATLGAPTGGDLDIFVSRSSDNGATWAAASRIDSNDIADSGDDQRPALATDGLGNWVAAWHSNDNLDGITDGDWDLFTSRSTDNGATWTTGALLNANGGSDTGVDEFVRVTTDTAGNWIAIWDSSEDLAGVTGTDFDILFAQSTDAGLTWSAPALFNTSGTTDSDFDLVAQVSTDRAGNWIGVWESNDTLPGAIGNDFDIHYARFTLDPDLTATTIVPATTGPTNAASVSFDVSFRYDTKDFNNASDLVITHSGTANSGVSISGGPRNYTVNVTGLSGEGTFTLAVSAASDVQSLIGNPLVSSVTSAAVSIERVPPTIVLSSAAGDPVAGAISVTATLSEASTNFTSGDVTPTNATLSDFSGSGTSYSFTLTSSSEGSFGAVVNADTFTDAIGNGNIASNTFARTADMIGPAVTLSSASGTFVNGAISVDVSLTESSTNFVAGDVSVSNATVSDFAGSGTSFSFTLTPSSDGSFGASVDAGTLSDALGNANTASNVLTRTADTVGPTVSMSSTEPDPTNASPIAVTVSFNEAVSGFTAGDITLSNASVSKFAGSGANYSFDLTPSGEGSVTANIAGAVAIDAAGNDNSAALQFSRVYDSVLPSVSMSSVSANPTNISPIAVTVSFDEPVTGFLAGDVLTSNASVSNFAGSGADYSFDLTPSGQGTVTADIEPAVAVDAAGNANTAAAQFTRSFDNIAPTISLSSAAGDPVNGAIAVSISLSDSSVNFGAGDVSLTNATLSNFSGSGASYSFTLTPVAEGSFGASVDAATFTDAAGNTNTASNVLSRSADFSTPSVTLSSASASFVNGAISVAVSLSAVSTDFAEGDVTLVNGTLSGFSGSGTSYSFTLTPNAEGVFSASVDAGTFTNAAGNPNTASNTLSRTADLTAPGVSMSSAATDPTNLSPIPVTVSFDEPLTGFTSGDISATNATINNFAGSGASYTFDLVPSGEGTVTADIAAAVAADAATNANTAATQFSRAYDSVAPTILLSSAAGDPVNGAISVSVTLSSPSTNFASEDLGLTNATAISFSGFGTSYSFTLTPIGAGTMSVSVAGGAFTDAANNGNTASNTLSRTVDLTAPTVSMSSAAPNPTGLSSIPVTVTFSKSVIGFTSSDISAGNATVSAFSGSGASYSFNLVPASGGTVTANISAAVCTDAAGNANTAAAQFSRDYGVPPVITAIDDLTIYDGSSYSVTPTLAQGSGTLTWTLTAPGSPPTNMAINASTGRVTWTASLAFSPVDVTISVSGPGGSDTESWRIDVRPSIWVDFAYTGVEIGSPAQPFNTLGEAVSAAVSGDAIQIKGNTATNFTLETGTLSKPLIIDSSNGTIRVGGDFGGARSLSSGAAPAPTQGTTGFVSRGGSR